MKQLTITVAGTKCTVALDESDDTWRFAIEPRDAGAFVACLRGLDSTLNPDRIADLFEEAATEPWRQTLAELRA
jgi:hypothetical protein